MNTDLLVNPVATSSVVAVFVCTLLLIILVKSRVQISYTLAQWRAQIFTRTGFFWIVNLVFMGVSVLHAGDFFGITGKDDFARYLGFAVSFFLDLVTIILMQAMLEARYRGEENRARQFLFFIVLCCGTSTFANLAMSLNDFDPVQYLPHAPLWVQIVTPYVLASFPLFVIMMSIAAEMIINVRPLEQLDEGEYEADEKKRLKIMEIRNTYAQKQAAQELLAIEISNMRLDNKRMRRSSFSFRQRHTTPQVAQPVDIEALKASLIDGIREEIKASYEPQIAELKSQLEQKNSHQDDVDEAASNVSLSDAQADEDAQSDAQEEKPIDLQERRSLLSENAKEVTQVDLSTDPEIVAIDVKRMSGSGATDAQKLANDKAKMRREVADILKKEPDITGAELAKLTGLSISQANRIKAQIRDAQTDTAS